MSLRLSDLFRGDEQEKCEEENKENEKGRERKRFGMEMAQPSPSHVNNPVNSKTTQTTNCCANISRRNGFIPPRS
jgi:hypothetical protein